MRHRQTPPKVGVYRGQDGYWRWICAQCGINSTGSLWTTRYLAQAHYRGHITVRKECRALFPYSWRTL